jgi:thioesterase domain-containing protein/acyl carrier protein
VPSGFVKLEQLPLTPNGKVDRKALPEANLGSKSVIMNVPRNDIEAKILDIWRSVLCIDEIGLKDNFFELGGHSLHAVRLAALCERHLGYRPPIHALFEAPVLEEYAAIIRPRFRAKSVVELGGGNKDTGLVCFHAAGGAVFSYWSLAKKLGRIKAVYADDDAKALQNIKCLAQKYAETLLGDEFPISGFLGWSFGGLIAYECARIFAKNGIIVPVIMLDSHIHSKDQIYKDGSDAEMLFDALGLKSKNALHLTIEEAINEARSLGVLPLDFSAGEAIKLAERLRFANRGIAAYKPGLFCGNVYFFSSTDSDPKKVVEWEKFIQGGFEVTYTQANHHTIIEEPFISNIAERLKCILF